jgi:23S rRNA (guanine2445-N2)-methyltransferase / 23S rRNA (guanine2069-N7)-methyltransferase
MFMEHQYFAACPKGLEGILSQELESFGASDLRETVAGVYFNGSIEVAYRACLWSRLANKILMPLCRFTVRDADALYDGVKSVAWEEHINAQGTLLVDFVGTDDVIRNSQFGALKVKDAVVDALREATGERPSIAKMNPDIRLNARLSKGTLVLSLDLSGASLHRRGYRVKQGIAPMKENLAAAILIRAGWPEIAKQGGALLDPMCGSGTLLIEAAMIASDTAPGLNRSFGFERWLKHENETWLALREEAIERRRVGMEGELVEIRGYDADVKVIRAAEENIEEAQLDHWLRLSRKELKDFKMPTHKTLEGGLVISNPPYGERLGEIESLKLLYQYLGDRLKEDFQGWRAGVFTGNPDLGKHMGMRAEKKYKLFNGTLPAELLMFTIEEDSFHRHPIERDNTQSAVKAGQESLTAGAAMLANRLKKNQKQMAKWKKKNEIECYRLYDADMPEYSAAIDIYGDHVHVQEYQAPKTVDENKAQKRFEEIQAAVPNALGVSPANISYKQRRRNRGKSQYEKMEPRGQHADITVSEGQAKFLINLWDYLDCGLFLDHRPVRNKIAQMAKGQRFLNLFCYTATASVHAALGGARFTVSVDMSNTYLTWARKNYALNGLGEARNRLEQADCTQWLKKCEQTFDLILLDPPSFSNSKKMEDVLDIQRDHVELIQDSMKILEPGGTLIFSNNLRSFKLDAEALADFVVEDITSSTLDQDFQRNSKIHQCWTLKHR